MQNPTNNQTGQIGTVPLKIGLEHIPAAELFGSTFGKIPVSEGPEYLERVTALVEEMGPLDNLLTDTGNSRLFSILNRGKAIFVPGHGWHVYNGSYWEKGNPQILAEKTALAITSTYSQFFGEEIRRRIKDWEAACLKKARLDAMISLSEVREGIRCPFENINRDPCLLSVQNGTLDLRTGKLNDHSPDDLIAKIASVEYDPNAKCPRWEQHLREVLDPEQIEYLQIALGYSLTGCTNEQVFFVLYGTGQNGKTVTTRAIQNILGEYGGILDASSLMDRSRKSIPNDIAHLPGLRFVVTSELDEGKSFDERFVKQLTGEDPIQTKWLFKEYFDFIPTAKFWVHANHLPRIHGTDYGIWRRMRVIEFRHTIPDEKRDNHLIEKLEKEKSGILNWLVEGCRKWLENGLLNPDWMQTTVEAYKNQMDPIGAFVKECCAFGSNQSVCVSDLYEAYLTWCEENEEIPVEKALLGKSLLKRFNRLKKATIKNVRSWRGIDLNSRMDQSW